MSHKELADAIIIRAAKDLSHARKYKLAQEIEELTKFFLSEWYDCLGWKIKGEEILKLSKRKEGENKC